ncbi:ADP-ribose diphosphatase [Corallincola holothuriorum]|uniref:ADP-ribose pyrophosphatase n=1 Tax=Corallincola holothuriorum TaxID=2282215 RepID=A0A368NMD9_9GAMM|nr:ADP-ribose diphosphatase [Corallincola holothuriorum]
MLGGADNEFRQNNLCFEEYPLSSSQSLPDRFTDKDVELLAKQTLYAGFFSMVKYRLRHKLFAGGWSEEMDREVFERGHAVVVLPYDPESDSVVIQEQFRVGACATTSHPWLYELVAGIIEPGESAEEVAHREAAEEAGLTLGRVEHLFSYLVSPGGTTERIELYVGEVDSRGIGGLHGLANEHEDIRVQVLPRSQVLAMLADGQVENAATIIALQWLQLHGDALKSRWEVD